MALKPASTFQALQSPIADLQTGQVTWVWLKKFQEWEQKLQNGLNLIGQFIGNIGATATVGNRTEGIGTTLQNLTSTGQLDSLTHVAADVNLDHIANTASYQKTTPNDVSGAATAYSALVASGPVAGRSLIYSGTSWAPAQVAFSEITGTAGSGQLPAPGLASLGGVQAINPAASQWVSSIDTFGVPTLSQPAFSDISGTANATQLPVLSAMSGSITSGQLPADVPVVSFGVGAPSGASTQGYLYFDTTGSPYHGYIYNASAWHQFS